MQFNIENVWVVVVIIFASIIVVRMKKHGEDTLTYALFIGFVLVVAAGIMPGFAMSIWHIFEQVQKVLSQAIPV